MKKNGLIFLGVLAIFMAGCSKDTPEVQAKPDPDAWMYDVSLPVPIRFGSSELDTRAAIEDMSDMVDQRFAFIAVNKNADNLNEPDDIDFPDNARAKYVGVGSEEGKFVFMTPKNSAEEMVYYYPVNTDECYSFYGYHSEETKNNVDPDNVPPIAREEDVVAVEIGVAVKEDILWGKAEAEAEIASNGYMYDGFNAAYIRKIQKTPCVEFIHPATCLRFTLTRKENRVSSNLIVSHAYLDSIPSKARLCLYDLARDKMGQFTDVIETNDVEIAKGVALTTNVGKKLDDLFIMPQTEPLKLRLVFALPNSTTGMSMTYELDPNDYPAIGPEGFLAGHRYNFNLIVWDPVKVEITASVKGYDDAFVNDPIDPDLMGK